MVVPAPLRGALRTCRLVAVPPGTPGPTTPPSSFTFALYSSPSAFVADGSGNPTPALAAGSEAYRVTPDVATSSNAPVAPGGFDLGYYFDLTGGQGPIAGIEDPALYLLVSGLGKGGTGCAATLVLAIETPTLI